jgi:DHA3 family macrolide efflux protein-like MFS transporter
MNTDEAIYSPGISIIKDKTENQDGLKISEDSDRAKETTIKGDKLWSKNFFLLWQGQLVSVFGDAVYALALGFWIMAKTGSTALMGTLMAVSTLPSVLISPFAGVIVDRVDRKKLLIITDAIRGLAVVLLAIAAYRDALQIWMVFTAGIVLSIGGAFFSPAVSSAIPDLVPQSKLVGANSVIGMLNTGANIVGSSSGGYLLQILGAPFLFLFNGLSFIVSTIMNIFIKIPKIEAGNEQHFMTDMREGYKFIWHFKALRYLLFISAGVNFIFSIAIVLYLPLFQRTQSLGSGKYGVAMAFMTGGMFIAMAMTSLIKIPPKNRMILFMSASILMTVFFAAFGISENFSVMSALIFGGGFCIAIVNVFVQSTIQLTVPQELRGKVFSLITMVCMSLTPFAMAIGGVLGEIFPLRHIVFACFVILFLGFLPCAFIKSLKRFVNFDPEKETIEDIM